MSDLLNSIKNLPEISFIDNMTLEDVQTLLVSTFQEKYKEITKKGITLARADPYRVMLLASAQIIYQGLMQVDKAGKMNFLKYSQGDYLRNLAALKNVSENEPKKASAQVRWRLASPREAATAIPAGSRVTASFDVYFETTEYHEIPAGQTEATITMSCTEAGEAGNGFMPGELAVLVDPVGFIAEVANVDTSAGGTDRESDESIAERVFLAPSSYSTAGPDDAYIYWVKDYDSQIGDVLPTSPSPGVVDIRFIMADGSLPSDGEIAGVLSHLQQRGRRPLTDKVEAGRPDTVPYRIDAKYYIDTADADRAMQIQESAQQALREYKLWQGLKIGRDINPDELLVCLKNAGVKRVEITEPHFTKLEDSQVAFLESENLAYGGVGDG